MLLRLRFQNLVNPDKDNVLGLGIGGEALGYTLLDSTDTVSEFAREPMLLLLATLPMFEWLWMERDSLDILFVLHTQEDVELTRDEVIEHSDKIELSRVLNPSCHGKNISSSLSQNVIEFVFTCDYPGLDTSSV